MTEMYTYQNGKSVEIPVITIPNEIEKCFKINLPSDEADNESGTGEGIWACSTDEVLAFYEKDEETKIHLVMLLNDSMYYPILTFQTIIPVEFRKGQRPVAVYEELVYHFGEAKRDEVVQFLVNRKK